MAREKDTFETDDVISSERMAAKSNIKVLTTEKPSNTKRSNSDYIRLYVGEYKEYLTKIAALESLNTGEQVSVSRYVLKLIEADKKAREKEL